MLKRKYLHKQRPLYKWVCEMLLDPENPESRISVYTGSHKKPTDANLKILYLKFHSQAHPTMCYVGWDIDRHRFFVEGRTQHNVDTQRRLTHSRFLRDHWEMNHGYYSSDIKYWHL